MEKFAEKDSLMGDCETILGGLFRRQSPISTHSETDFRKKSVSFLALYLLSVKKEVISKAPPALFGRAIFPLKGGEK